jgi:hypothetical protein
MMETRFWLIIANLLIGLNLEGQIKNNEQQYLVVQVQRRRRIGMVGQSLVFKIIKNPL